MRIQADDVDRSINENCRGRFSCNYQDNTVNINSKCLFNQSNVDVLGNLKFNLNECIELKYPGLAYGIAEANDRLILKGKLNCGKIRKIATTTTSSTRSSSNPTPLSRGSLTTTTSTQLPDKTEPPKVTNVYIKNTASYKMSVNWLFLSFLIFA